MATKKGQKQQEKVVDTIIDNTQEAATTVNNTDTQTVSNDVLASLLQTITNLQEEVKTLKNNQNITTTVETLKTSDVDEKMVKFLESLANNRNNKEVVIVHNAERFGGLTTYIELSNLTLSLTHLGEQRTLSWDQFEELCSKYSHFLDMGIIKVASEYRELCDKYHIQCYEDSTAHKKLTLSALENMGNYSDAQLTEFFNALSAQDQRVVLDYWLGKCYARPEDKDERFYNRYKVELLNKLSNSYVFDNIIADMNYNDTKVRN